MRPPVMQRFIMAHVTDYDDGISAVDSQFIRPHATSVHLIVEKGRAAIVDAFTLVLAIAAAALLLRFRVN